MKPAILELAQSLFPKTREHYHYLHSHPELSFNEANTADYICNYLDSLQVSYRRHVGGYGVVARIEGKISDGKVVALRADMDALPINEETALPFSSLVPSVMHACGHDAHTACLLSVVDLFSQIKDQIRGVLIFVFQPAEERYPGGARLMIEDDLFGSIKPDLLLAQHVYVDLPSGSIAISGGTVMASADEIHLTVRGRGGHGALPHLLNDTVLAASQIVVNLQQLISRRKSPFEPAVLTFGRLVADGATNIIPHEVVLAGTFRCMNQQLREELRHLIKETIQHTVTAYGCTVDISMPEGYPPTVNNHGLAERALVYATELLGEEAVHPMPARMTSEDFGFFTQQYPSLFYRVGVRNPEGKETGGLHTSTFFIDEESLITGVATLAHLALSFLNEKS